MKRVLVVVVAAVVLGGVALWWFVLRDNAPERLALSTATTQPRSSSGGAPPGDVSGQWVVKPGGQSVVGYRVREKFANLPSPTDAVGRTNAVTASFTIEGGKVTAGRVEADLRSLQSDRDRRDQRLRTQGLETDRFPTASFELSEPLAVGSPAANTVVKPTAHGRLTLHGVTREVQIPLEARWTGDRVEVVGHLPIRFADHRIDPPSIAGMLTVEDHGEMELRLVFVRA